jgi:hypothetical protein
MATLISGSTGVNKITDGTIVNADIASGAAIAGSKLVMPTGSVLQVVQNTTSTTTHVNSTTTLTTATDLNVTITPSSSSSKILVSVNCGGLVLGVTNAILFNMLRDSTTIVARARQGYNSPSAQEWTSIPFFMSYLDSPSTSSAITYSFKIGMGASSSCQLQINSGTGTNDGIVTAMEIAG